MRYLSSRPAPPYTGERNHLTKTDRSNQKLETHLGIFAFVRTQTGGLAFWCMLGTYSGLFAVKAFNDCEVQLINQQSRELTCSLFQVGLACSMTAMSRC